MKNILIFFFFAVIIAAMNPTTEIKQGTATYGK
jgi:hypothetical protein